MHQSPATSAHVIAYLVFTLWGALLGLFLGWLIFA